MRISAALSANLTDFARTLDPSTIGDLDDSVRSLKRDAALAVRSLVGMTLTVTTQDQPVTLTSIDEWVQPSDIRSSLEVSFRHASATESTGVITFFAENPNAFTDLADDLALEFTTNPSLAPGSENTHILIDTVLDPVLEAGLTGVSELATLNRAVGALIAGGRTQEGALLYLATSATTPADRLVVAARILTEAKSA